MTTEILPNELKSEGKKYTNIFVHQPYGSQQFPDFLVFTENNIYSVESKYSKQNGNKPVWNSNLPKSTAIYIFGCYAKRDVTFFIGEDILPQNERVILNQFFMYTTTKVMDDFQSELVLKFMDKEMNFEHGFNVYIRKAFDQNQVVNASADIDFFGSKNRSKYENNVISSISNWETPVKDNT